jgi:epsin
VRQRVTELIQFLQDDKAIREERKKARQNRDKYTGVSSDEFSGSGGFGPSKG